MSVVLSSFALTDLRHIHRFIDQDNPARAIAFVAELRDTAERLARLPHGFPLVTRYERQGIRRRSWKGYGILYSVVPNGIFIHRILGPGQGHDRALRLS